MALLQTGWSGIITNWPLAGKREPAAYIAPLQLWRAQQVKTVPVLSGRSQRLERE